MNRRMYREEKERVDTRERVRKFRAKQASNEKCNGDSNVNDTRCTESEYETEDSVLVFKDLRTNEKNKKSFDLDVSAIYSAYPRKVGRGAAIKAITNAFNRLTSAVGDGSRKFSPADASAFLFASTEAFADSPAGKAGEYCPHPATWFTQSRYLDDPKEWQRGNNGGISNGKTDRAYATAADLIQEIEDRHGSNAGELLPGGGAD